MTTPSEHLTGPIDDGGGVFALFGPYPYPYAGDLPAPPLQDPLLAHWGYILVPSGYQITTDFLTELGTFPYQLRLRGQDEPSLDRVGELPDGGDFYLLARKEPGQAAVYPPLPAELEPTPPAPTPVFVPLRHLSRHLQATVQDHIQRHLTALGWIGPAEGVPFGARAVDYQTVRPSESLLKSLAPNLVSVSFGLQGDDTEEQMGGGLLSQDHVLFVDVYAENEGIGLALAEDVRDLLVGRASYRENPSRYLVLEDQMTEPPTPVPAYKAEFTDVFREPSDRELANADWQIVKATAYLHLPGEH